MRRARLLTFAVLAVILAASSAQSALAASWIVYDNGARGAFSTGNCSGVRFSLPAAVASAHLLTVSFQANAGGLDVYVYVTGPDHTTLLVPVVDTKTPTPPAWLEIDVAGHPKISGDFYVAICAQGGGPPARAVMDTSGVNFEGRSVYGTVGLSDMTIPADSNYLIRAEIDPISSLGAPVGGFTETVNKPAVILPYLSLFGAFAVISVVILRRKYGN